MTFWIWLISLTGEELEGLNDSTLDLLFDAEPETANKCAVAEARVRYVGGDDDPCDLCCGCEE